MNPVRFQDQGRSDQTLKTQTSCAVNLQSEIGSNVFTFEPGYSRQNYPKACFADQA